MKHAREHRLRLRACTCRHLRVRHGRLCTRSQPWCLGIRPQVSSIECSGMQGLGVRSTRACVQCWRAQRRHAAACLPQTGHPGRSAPSSRRPCAVKWQRSSMQQPGAAPRSSWREWQPHCRMRMRACNACHAHAQRHAHAHRHPHCTVPMCLARTLSVYRYTARNTRSGPTPLDKTQLLTSEHRAGGLERACSCSKLQPARARARPRMHSNAPATQLPHRHTRPRPPRPGGAEDDRAQLAP